jgi:predicted dehydrogenase
MTDFGGLSAAVVGTGFIGAVHVDALRRLGVGIRGVVGSSPERAEPRARQLGVGRVYVSFEEMLADASVDVVHITSPNSAHAEQAESALRAGKHVVCEKPLALSSEETARLRRVAAETGLVAAVNFNIRFYPQVHEMRSRIRAGSVGVPYLVTGGYRQDWLLHDTDWNWRADPDQGGDLRVVGDIGSHWFDLAGFVTGQHVAEVIADLPTFVPTRRRPTGAIETFSAATGADTVAIPSTSEDAAIVLIRFDGGARGSLVASQVSAGHKNDISIEVNGAQSSVAWRGERPDRLWIGHRSGPNESLASDASLLSPEAAAIARLPGGHVEGFENAFAAMYRAIYSDIAAGGPSPSPVYATFDDGHEEMLVVEAVARSARSGSWVAIERNGE